MSNAATRVDQARWWSLTNEPFYGSLAMGLSDVFDPSVPTAATDGKVIKWNPGYVDTLTDQEIRFVLLHETLHCGHLHLFRLPPDERGNAAGDHEINLTLAAVPGISMPEGGLADPQYEGLSCEEIFRRLPDDPKADGGGESGTGESGSADAGQGGSSPGDGQQDSGSGNAPHDPCGSFTAPAVDPAADAQPEDVRDEWEGRVIQAAQAAQALGQGDIPADMQRELERMRHQTVDWRREMADFVRSTLSSRNDWSRAARRHAWQPVIYPRKRVDGVGVVIFARDTSGSINNEVCAEFTALITDCVSEMGCQGLVIDCDSRIQSEYWISDYEDCPLTAKGGGGTAFQPVFDRAAELHAQGEQIAGVVYLTDLIGPAPQSRDLPTLWVATTDREPPFGRAVRVENAATRL